MKNGRNGTHVLGMEDMTWRSPGDRMPGTRLANVFSEEPKHNTRFFDLGSGYVHMILSYHHNASSLDDEHGRGRSTVKEEPELQSGGACQRSSGPGFIRANKAQSVEVLLASRSHRSRADACVRKTPYERMQLSKERERFQHKRAKGNSRV